MVWLRLIGPVVACAIVVTSCTGVPTWGTSKAPTAIAAAEGCATSDVAGDTLTQAQVGDAVLCIVNRLRADRGLGALRTSPQLARAADLHSADMVASGVFSHTGSRGDTLRQRAIRAGYVPRRGKLELAETIAWGTGSYATPAELVESFMQSPAHRKIMLSARFRDAGVGIRPGAPVTDMGDDAATLTVDFGRR